jgi:hypothetical protein
MPDRVSLAYSLAADATGGGRLDFLAHHPALDWVRAYRRHASRASLGALIEEPVYGTGERTTAEGETPSLTVQHILANGQIRPTPATYVGDVPAAMVLRVNDILIARTGFSLGKAALITDAHAGFAFGSFCLRLRVKADSPFSAAFLARFINSEVGQAQIRLLRTGSDKPNINTDQVKSLRIPLVPEAVQRQIVERVGVWEDGARRAEVRATRTFEIAEDQFLAELGIRLPPRIPDTFYFQRAREGASLAFGVAASAMGARWQYLYHDPRNILPDVFGTLRLVPLSTILDGPVRFGVQPEIDVAGTVKVFKTLDVKARRLDYEHAQAVTEEFAAANPGACIQRGDVVVSATGYGSMGKVGVYDRSEPALISGELLAFRPRSGYDPLFISHWLRSRAGQMQFDRYFSGTSGQTHLYDRDLAQFLVPSDVPRVGIEPAVQSRVLATVERVLDAYELHKRKARRRWANAKACFKALLEPYDYPGRA